MKRLGEKICMVTAHDYPSGVQLRAAGVDVALVGDSLGMVALGYGDTRPVTLGEMLHHCGAARRGLGGGGALLVMDLPFGAYEESPAVALRAAQRAVKEGGADAVKVEGGSGRVAETVRVLVDAGISAMGHVGLTPQAGTRAESRSPRDAVPATRPEASRAGRLDAGGLPRAGADVNRSAANRRRSPGTGGGGRLRGGGGVRPRAGGGRAGGCADRAGDRHRRRRPHGRPGPGVFGPAGGADAPAPRVARAQVLPGLRGRRRSDARGLVRLPGRGVFGGVPRGGVLALRHGRGRGRDLGRVPRPRRGSPPRGLGEGEEAAPRRRRVRDRKALLGTTTIIMMFMRHRTRGLT